MKYFLSFFATLTLTVTVQAEKQPNILFIQMEDLGVQIPAYGDRTVATPNLDKLASEGVIFERAHVTAATCAASRGSLFSGLYPHQNGIMGFVKQHGFHYRDGVPTFVMDLKAAGYSTGLTYKNGVESAHHRSNPVPFDFHPKYTENWLTGLKSKNAAKSQVKPPLTSYSVDNFQYFLEHLKDGQPFYFQAQTPDTHHPWKRPHFIREGDPDWPYPDVDLSRITATPGWGDTLQPSGELRKVIGEYYRAIQRVDWYVGRILALLDEYGHADNTLVIFSADHGPSHLLRGKTTPYENGLRVPFIVRWPGHVRTPGTRSNELVSFVDLYPTFVAAAGLEIPKHLPGYSILPIIEGKKAHRRQRLYSAYVAHTTGMHQYWPTRTVTDGRWKLIHHLFGDGKRRRYPDGNQALSALNRQLKKIPAESLPRQIARRSEVPPAFELYDLDADPHELTNLSGDPKYAEIEKRLRTRLQHWRERTADPFLDSGFVETFTAAYARNVELWKSLGGSKMKDMDAIDFEEFILDWNPASFLGNKDL